MEKEPSSPYDKLIDGKFDYVSKNNYVGYNQTLDSIPDDPSSLDATLAELKKAYRTNGTRSIEFRIQQLKNLRNGLEEMKDELC